MFKVWNCETWLKFNLTKLTRNDINKAGRLKLYLIWSSDQSSSSNPRYIQGGSQRASLILCTILYKYIISHNWIHMCTILLITNDNKIGIYSGRASFFRGVSMTHTHSLRHPQNSSPQKHVVTHTTLWQLVFLSPQEVMAEGNPPNYFWQSRSSPLRL